MLKATASITSVYNGGSRNATIKAGDTIAVCGEYLKFDPNDQEQGLFLAAADGTETKLTYYQQNTGTKILARIESGIAAGKTYALILRNTPTNTKVVETKYKESITISE
jgi:hypothetical protein